MKGIWGMFILSLFLLSCEQAAQNESIVDTINNEVPSSDINHEVPETESSAEFVQVNSDDIGIIGTDGRRRVVDTLVKPFRYMGQLETVTPISATSWSTQYCTATLISPTHLVTAAHCVTVNTTEVASPENVTFFAGRDGENNPFEGVVARDIFVPQKWLDSTRINANDHMYDYAVIKLERSPAYEESEKGYISIVPVVLPVYKNYSREVLMAGYPHDKEFGSIWKNTDEEEALLSPDLQYFPHALDSKQGMSGAAIRVHDFYKNEEVIVGVNVTLTSRHNYGVAFTADVYRDIQNWLKL